MEQTGLLSILSVAGGLWLVVYLAVIFLPLLTIGRLFPVDKSPLQGHLAGQLLRLGGWTALVAALPLLAIAVCVFTGMPCLTPEMLATLKNPEHSAVALRFGASAGLGLVACMVMGLFWKTLRKKKWASVPLLLASALCGAGISPLMELNHLLWQTQTGGLGQLLNDTVTFSLPWFTQGLDISTSTLHNAFIWLYGPGAAGGIALIWLLLRRDKDDFGRDYYTFAARVCASYAAAGGLISVMNAVGFTGNLIELFGRPMAPGLVLPEWLNAGGELLYSLLGADTVHRMGLGTVPHALGFLCLTLAAPHILSAVLWFAVARAALPMRRKFAMWAALLLYTGGIILTISLFRVAHLFLVLATPVAS